MPLMSDRTSCTLSRGTLPTIEEGKQVVVRCYFCKDSIPEGDPYITVSFWNIPEQDLPSDCADCDGHSHWHNEGEQRFAFDNPNCLAKFVAQMMLDRLLAEAVVAAAVAESIEHTRNTN